MGGGYGYEDEASQFDEDSAFDEAVENITEIERRHLLERQGRIAADITLDLQDKGALYLYSQRCRVQAVSALMQLADVSPSDTNGIIQLQAVVKKFREVIAFIHGELEAGSMAAQTILSEYGHHGGPAPDADLLQPAEPAWRRRR